MPVQFMLLGAAPSQRIPGAAVQVQVKVQVQIQVEARDVCFVLLLRGEGRKGSGTSMLRGRKAESGERTWLGGK